MIILKISNIKDLTNHLLVKSTFDNWLVSEVSITTFTTFSIDGTLTKEFYSQEELAELDNKDKCTWGLLKPKCYDLIKGTKPPVLMKFVLQLPASTVKELVTASCYDLSYEDINGLFININYNQGQMNITTGSSIKKFTLDKSLDEAFEKYFEHFLNTYKIDYEII